MSHQPSPSPTGGKKVPTTTNVTKGSNVNKDPKSSKAAPISKSNNKGVMAPPPKPRKRAPGPPPEPKDKRPPLPPGGPRDPYDCMIKSQPCHIRVTTSDVSKGPGIAKSWRRTSTSMTFVSIMRIARRVYEHFPHPPSTCIFSSLPLSMIPIFVSSMSLLSPLPRQLPSF